MSTGPIDWCLSGSVMVIGRIIMVRSYKVIMTRRMIIKEEIKTKELIKKVIANRNQNKKIRISKNRMKSKDKDNSKLKPVH